MVGLHQNDSGGLGLQAESGIVEYIMKNLK
jgi:hypothetical protein